MVHVWCSMSESSVIVGPYFFDDDTINGQNFHKNIVPKLKSLGKVSSAILKQNGAPAEMVISI